MSTTVGETNVTPVLRDTDIKFYLSGGVFNSDPNNSIGGEISSFELPASTPIGGLFDHVNEHEMLAGDIEFRCIYIKNTHQDRALLGAKVWIETGTTSIDTALAISVGAGGTRGSEVLVPTEQFPPSTNIFQILIDPPETPNIGDLGPGDWIALWIAYIIHPSATPIAEDLSVIRIDGELEPSASFVTLPPSPPPAIVCPSGHHWDPVTQTCLPDNVPIVCPIGFHYDETTQRCVPNTTPPPTTVDLVIAAVGDNDEDATFENIAAHMPLTGPNPGLFLSLGDNDYPDANSDQFIEWCESLGPVIHPARISPNIGNHDDEEDGSANKRNQLVNEFPLLPPEGYYAFQERNIAFIVLDTQSNLAVGSAQYNFCLNALQQAAANPSIRWKIVHFHKPSLISASDYEPVVAIRNNYHPLFDQYKVDIIMNGHNHNYFRSFPVRANASNPAVPIVVNTTQGPYDLNTIDGRIFMTIGTGGRANDEFEDDPEPHVAARTPEFGVMFLTLQNNGQEIKLEWRNNSSGNPIEDTALLTKIVGGPAPAPQCPAGYHWDQVASRCLPDTQPPTVCPIGYHLQGTICVPDTQAPPDPAVNFPVAGVEWYYDAATTLAVPQTILAGNHTSDGVIMASNISSVTQATISSGFLNIDNGASPGEGTIFLDYHVRPRFAVDQQPGFNSVITFLFVKGTGQDSISIKDGNHPVTGFAFDGDLVFGGFGFSLHNTEIQTNVEYYHNVQSPNINAAYPGGRTLTVGQQYRVFATLRTDLVGARVVLNVWMVWPNENTWVKILHDRAYPSTGWAPGTVPAGDDQASIQQGPSFIKRHHYWIRNNGLSAVDLQVKDIRIGTLPFLSGNNPPGPGPDPPPTGGTIDSFGIRWLEAVGEQGVIEQSRDDPGDYRWSGNVNNVSERGYEITSIFGFDGVSGDGHFALKHWGPNHSGDCGHTEGGSCCCWYDTGIRSNGDVQTQIERPHPNNDDWSCPTCTMSNVGTSMDGNTIGLKWVVRPIIPGGDADNGGVKIKMWVDTDALGTDGRPRNNWVLVYDITDTGSILGDYHAPDEQDLENRVSDTDNVDAYGGGLHYRHMV